MLLLSLPLSVFPFVIVIAIVNINIIIILVTIIIFIITKPGKPPEILTAEIGCFPRSVVASIPPIHLCW